MREARHAEQHRHAHRLRERRRAAPGYFEIEVGAVTMGQLINDMAGGLKPRAQVKAVIPGGSSAKVLRAGETFKLKDNVTDHRWREIPMDFDSLAAAGSMAGSGGVIVMDDSRDMVWALNNINEFYAHESCGQCTPCREGSLWMKKITDRMLAGGGVTQDPDNARRTSPTTSPAGPSAPSAKPAPGRRKAFVEKFRDEFAAARQKPVPPPMPPEYTPEELIAEDEIPETCRCAPRSRLGKSRRSRERYESGKQESRKRFAKPQRHAADHRCGDRGSSRPGTGIS